MASGIIGVITHDISKELLNDEIQFHIPVTNPGYEEQCYYLEMFNAAGKLIEMEPTTWIYKNKILPGVTEVMHITSVGRIWHVNTVAGTTVTFKLMADNVYPLGVCAATSDPYELVATKEYVVPEYYGDVPEKTIWIILFIIIIAAYIFVKVK